MQTNEPEQTVDSDNSAALTEAAVDENTQASTPGQILQAERLRQNLSEKDVADKLHITMHYVRAIEANRFDKLPGAVFAKGYIKSYALLLELDVDAVTVLFDGINSQQQEKQEESNRRLMAQRRSDRNKPWVYASVACFVLGFGGLWAYNQFAGTASSQQTSAPGTSAAPAPATIASRPMAQTPAPAPAVTTPALGAVAPGRPVTETAAMVVPVTTPAPAVNESAVEPVTDSSTGSSTENVTLLTALATLAAPSTAAAEPATAASTAPQVAATSADANLDSNRIIVVDAAGEDILRINFSGESWVEVNDSHANQIYRDIREAGDVLEISGDAPFNILLGDAPFTRMFLNGDEIDVSDDIRIDNSARLTVGL